MPNLIMEYSYSIEEIVDVNRLLKTLHHVVLECDLFDSSSVKSRSICYQNWFVGEVGSSADFIHINFDLLDGRTQEQKKRLSCQLMDVLKQEAGDVHSLTINIRDMDKECFLKVLN